MADTVKTPRSTQEVKDANAIDAASQSLFNAKEELIKARAMCVRAFRSAHDMVELTKLQEAIQTEHVRIVALRHELDRVFGDRQ